VEADGVAERRQQPPCEELDALFLLKTAGAGKESLEPIGVFLHGPGAPTLGELEHRGGTERWPKPHVQELLEVRPVGCAVVLLDLGEPQLRNLVKVVRGDAHLLVRRRAMLKEVCVTLVEEKHRVGRAVVAGKIPLLVLGVEFLTAPAVVAAVVAPAGG
jgi:hypothetical protein